MLLPGCTSTGVKLREGRFEVKAICGRTAEPIAFVHGVTGRADGWVKWSAGLLPVALSRETAGRLDVTKWRLLHTFSLTSAGVAGVKEDALPETGGTVELTAVQVQNSSWWTLGLEAVGAPDQEDLIRLAGHFFGQA